MPSYLPTVVRVSRLLSKRKIEVVLVSEVTSTGWSAKLYWFIYVTSTGPFAEQYW